MPICNLKTSVGQLGTKWIYPFCKITTYLHHEIPQISKPSFKIKKQWRVLAVSKLKRNVHANYHIIEAIRGEKTIMGRNDRPVFALAARNFANGYHLANRPYSRYLFPTYPELLRCQIQSGQSELVSLIHFLPRDIFPCAVCVQTIKGHLTVNSTT